MRISHKFSGGIGLRPRERIGAPQRSLLRAGYSCRRRVGKSIRWKSRRRRTQSEPLTCAVLGALLATAYAPRRSEASKRLRSAGVMNVTNDGARTTGTSRRR